MMMRLGKVVGPLIAALVLAACGKDEKKKTEVKPVAPERSEEVSYGSRFKASCLRLTGDGVDHDGEAAKTMVATLQSLEVLHRDDDRSQLTEDSCKEAVAKARETASLSLAGRDLEVLGSLAHLHKLTKLDLSGNPRITKDEIKVVIAGLAKLQVLTLKNTSLTAEHIATLVAGHPNLIRIELEDGEKALSLRGKTLLNKRGMAVELVSGGA